MKRRFSCGSSSETYCWIPPATPESSNGRTGPMLFSGLSTRKKWLRCGEIWRITPKCPMRRWAVRSGMKSFRYCPFLRCKCTWDLRGFLWSYAGSVEIEDFSQRFPKTLNGTFPRNSASDSVKRRMVGNEWTREEAVVFTDLWHWQVAKAGCIRISPLREVFVTFS